MKTVSAGVIITDSRYTLVGHATGKPERWGYDIFKGGRESINEKYISAALRELYEETGITLTKNDLTPLGKFDYRPDKSLRLFLYRSLNVKKEFDLTKLKCTSFLEDGTPEMDKYKFVPVDKLHLFLYKSLSPIVFNAVHSLKKGLN